MLEKIYGKYCQTVIDTMMEGLMLVDPDGKIIFINPAFEQLSGYTKKEVEGQTCEILGCDTCFGTRKEGKDKYCALFKEGKVRKRKCIFQKKGGGKVHVLKNAALLRDENGKVVETPLGMFRRVSDAIAGADKEFGKSSSEIKVVSDEFFNMMRTKSAEHLLRLQLEEQIKPTSYNKQRVAEIQAALKNL